MKNFIKLFDLPSYDLYNELNTLINLKKIEWHKSDIQVSQICLNSTKDNTDNIFLGRGSLVYDWDKSYTDNNKLVVPKRPKVLKEEDFTILCSQFKDTLFEEIYNELNKKYVLGRVRIMKSKPKTCLSWHTDTSPRIHYPIKTQEGCFMVIDKEIQHLTKNTWWWTNTVVPHTAFNGSKEDRIHLVVVVLREK